MVFFIFVIVPSFHFLKWLFLALAIYDNFYFWHFNVRCLIRWSEESYFLTVLVDFFVACVIFHISWLTFVIFAICHFSFLDNAGWDIWNFSTLGVSKICHFWDYVLSNPKIRRGLFFTVWASCRALWNNLVVEAVFNFCHLNHLCFLDVGFDFDI